MLCTMARRQAAKVIAQDFPAGGFAAESSKEEGEMKPKSQGPAAELPSSLQEASGRLQGSRKPEARGSEDAELHGSAKEAPGGEKAAEESRSETREKSSAREEAAASKRSAKSLEGALEGRTTSAELMEITKQDEAAFEVHKCVMCSGEFSSSALLSEHMATHITATSTAPPPVFTTAVAANASKPHECPHASCGKSFATLRGLSKHWTYEPTHRPPPPDPPAEAAAPPPSLPAPIEPPTSLSEPTSPHKLEASPIQSPPSTPNSPFRTSSRNPTYFSIIRTRRSSNNDLVVPPFETGVKRSRVAAAANLPSAASPTKAMQLNTGEKEPVEETEKTKRAKDVPRKGGSHRPRTRSLSGSDGQAPPVPSPVADLKRSPVTRSSSKTVAFVSLPNRKKRRRQTRGDKQRDASADISPEERPRKELKLEKATEKSDTVTKEAQPQPQPQLQPPVKRKRGRPPKNRNLPPPASTSTSSTSSTPTGSSSVTTSVTNTPSSCESTAVSSASSLTSSTLSSSAGTDPSAAKSLQPMEESPLPSKEAAATANIPAKSALSLPLWDSISEPLPPPPPPPPPKDQTAVKVPPSQAPDRQILPAESPDIKARGSELPELPPIHPSVLPPTSCPPALSIPSILPKLCSKTEQQPPTTSSSVDAPSQLGVAAAITASEIPTAAGGVAAVHSAAVSPSITTLCSYNALGSGKAVSESLPAVNGKERAGAEDGDGGLKPALPSSEAGDVEIIEVKKPTPVEIDLTEGDETETKATAEAKLAVSEEKASVAAKPPEERQALEKKEEVFPMEVKVGGASEVGGAAKVGGAKDSPEEREVKASTQPVSKGEEKPRDAATTTAATVTQRAPSVIVSVLSSQEREGGEGGKPDAKPSTVEGEGGEGNSGSGSQQEQKLDVRRKLSMSDQSPVSYSPSTPTYSYPYPGAPYPPPPPMMFPPGAPPPSSMYPPYYPYPSATQSLPTAYIPPGLGMMPMMEPGGEGPPLMPPYTATHLPIATTVSGVRVSILDNPPSHLPTVPLHQMPRPRLPSPQQQMEHTTQSLGGQPPAVRTFVGAGSPSPDGPPGVDVSRPHQPHPLSQAYRSGGVMPPPGSGYMPQSSAPYVSVRLDHNGMPYVDWAPPSGLPPSQQQQQQRSGAGAAAKVMPLKMEPKQPQVDDVSLQPVDCPECGRSFKNNKALNGHMRLHGGFDWTKKPFTTFTSLPAAGSDLGRNGGTAANGSSSSSERANEQKPKKPKPAGVGVAKKRSRSRSISPAPAGRNKKRRTSEDSNPESSDSGKTNLGSKARQSSSNAGVAPVPSGPKVFIFDTQKLPSQDHAHSSGMHDAGTMTQPHRNATLDDLCRAVEELERLDKVGEEQDSKRRPKNIVIPHSHSSPALERERHRFGATPPYTPPPILSPARSLTMLAGTSLMQNQPCTPSRILQPWSSRRSSDTRHTSESEESYTEPRINVGKEFQATLPAFEGGDTSHVEHKATKAWQPMDITTHEDESVIDGFLELACSPAVLYSGRNKEYGLHLLYHLGGSVKEAVRVLLTGKSLFPSNHPLSNYNYSGSRRWSARERQHFRRAWRVHRKQFPLLKSAVEGKSFPEVIEYYYTWKKYCNDEYRGRNRHISEEILTDEDDTGYPQLHSSSSSGSAETDPTPPLQSSEGEKPRKDKTKKPFRNPQPPLQFHQQHPRSLSQSLIPDVPLAYAPHSATIGTGPLVQQYKCKYPGCNQVFTSIFALNGHIRVHGGSFYPKPPKMEPGTYPSKPQPTSYNFYPNLPSSSSGVKITIGGGSSMSSSTFAGSKQQRPLTTAPEFRSAHTLELARTLLELPQPRSPARSGGYHTPSPKPSPGTSSIAKSKSPSKKKMSSSSPGEREGFYPCNRCGRVFSKVKSRSAHMKSHIIKQN